jgi:hypothetical protein
MEQGFINDDGGVKGSTNMRFTADTKILTAMANEHGGSR